MLRRVAVALVADAKPGLGRPLVAAAIVTAGVTALSWLLPSGVRGTAVGLGFLGATWWLVLRKDEAEIARHGLSLGGLFEPAPLAPKRMLRDAGVALALAATCAAVVFPPFVFGYRIYWSHIVGHDLVWHSSQALTRASFDDVAGQLLVIALPEEAFFRGYLQSELDLRQPPSFRFLGASVGPSIFVTSAIFAVGHLLTEPIPARLAVFFPSLLFGWMRARSGGIGASLVFHAACNLLVSLLSRGYGLAR